MNQSAEDRDLHRRLVWLTLFRLSVITVLFGATFLLGVGTPSLPQQVQSQLLVVSIVGFVATVGFAAALRRPRFLHGIAYAEIGCDVGLAASLVYLTSASSTFAFMFILAVANGSLLLFRRGALVAATLSSGCFAFIRVGLRLGWLADPTGLADVAEPTSAVAFAVSVNLAGTFLAAALASYLAEQVKTKGLELTAKEQDYNQLAQLHQSILESISSGIATIDLQGRVAYVNRAGQEICARWLEPRPSFGIDQLLPGLRLEQGVVRQLLEIPSVEGVRSLGVTVSKLDSPSQGHVAVFQDLTDLKRLEEEAKRNEQLAAIGQVAAGLAHELRNPLASMSGAVQVLSSMRVEDSDERRLAGIVSSESERLNRLISDFLRFARPMPPQRARLDISEIVGEVMDMAVLSPEFSGLVFDRQFERLEMDADGQQLRQVVWNLLINAAQALHGTGTILVSVKSEGRKALLTVQDSGPGISQAHLQRLFHPFFTTKDNGTGLGLATVQALVRAHGGEVDAHNAAGGGAVFTVMLPIGAAPRSVSASTDVVGSVAQGFS